MKSLSSVATGQLFVPFALRSRISLDPTEHFGDSLLSGCLLANERMCGRKHPANCKVPQTGKDNHP